MTRREKMKAEVVQMISDMKADLVAQTDAAAIADLKAKIADAEKALQIFLAAAK